MEVHRLEQTEEVDADMFGSDVYFTFLYTASNLVNTPFFKPAHTGGFQFLHLLAQLEAGGPM